MGPSGSGKSTLLAFIAGTIDPAFAASGRVATDGVDVTDHGAERYAVSGILFQDDLLFPHLSGRRQPCVCTDRGRATGVATARSRALAEAELTGFADAYPATLSGGQRAHRDDANPARRAARVLAGRAVQQARHPVAPRFPPFVVRPRGGARAADSSGDARAPPTPSGRGRVIVLRSVKSNADNTNRKPTWPPHPIPLPVAGRRPSSAEYARRRASGRRIPATARPAREGGRSREAARRVRGL